MAREILRSSRVRKYAGLELNAFQYAGIFPKKFLDGAALVGSGTPIHDINGELLFRRIPLTRGRRQVGYADIAANTQLGASLLAISRGQYWNEKAILEEALSHAGSGRMKVKYDKIRFVAYSYPKIAVQFLYRGKERLMLEWLSWQPIREAGDAARERRRLEPGNFERWSLLDELPKKVKSRNRELFAERIEILNRIARRKKVRGVDFSKIRAVQFEPLVKKIKLFDTRELHYSTRSADHHPCYELRGQETNVWCVGASTQMLLDFYRYEYSQTRLAEELGLGTLNNPNGLPYARVGDVVTAIEHLTCNGLNASIIANPGWNLFRNEIRANRPLISFVPGHSRTVAGYTRALLSLPQTLGFRGLLVYDPWPPNSGVVTRWENFDTQTYQYAYTAQVCTI